MDSMEGATAGAAKPHVVCIPYPAQGHINPMMKLAKLLHGRGFHITFVNTEYNHGRLLRSNGGVFLDAVDGFRFAAIPDGLPPVESDVTQDVPALSDSTTKNCLAPFRDLLANLNADPSVARVSCIVSDGCMTFTLDAAEELGVPEALFWATGACGLLGLIYIQQLVEKGLVPLRDESCFTNGYLDMPIDWAVGMKGIRLKDFPNFIRTTDRDDIMLNFVLRETQRATKASAIIMNTFEDLESDFTNAIRTMLPPLYSIGSLSLLSTQLKQSPIESIRSNLWKEDIASLEWLDTREPGSVVYVNFGSVTVMSPQQLIEFAWGLAQSNHPFLWVIRPDLVKGESAILPPEFAEMTGERSLISNWVPQEQVLSHPSLGGFLTHCGWNSTLESIVSGVPIICWPFFAEQQTNCRYSCTQWGIGLEMDDNVKREEVESLVTELMEGRKGKELKSKAMEWKALAHKAAMPGGSSYDNFEKLVKDVLSP